MSTEFFRNRKVLIATAATLVLATGVWGVATFSRGKKTTLPKEIVQKIKAESNDPGKVMQTVHEAMDRKDLTEEQRHELWQNVHNVMEARMDQRMNDYFAANETQRKAILDRDIDEMQARMKEWQQRRAQRERDGATRGPGSTGGPGGGQRGGSPAVAGGRPGGASASAAPGPNQGGPRGGDHRGPPSRDQRMRRTQSRDPDQAARRMAYFTALHARAQERGIQMPGPMGGPGGRGGQ